MAGNRAGAQKAAAVRLGIDIAEYTAHTASGERRCSRCKDWHPSVAFGKDTDQPSGLATSCLESRRVRVRKIRTSFKTHGWLVPTRDGDKGQARHRVNYLVRRGKLSSPKASPCAGCGHVWMPGERRHEYHHHLGYGAEHQREVQILCTHCHADRDGRSARTHCKNGHPFTPENTSRGPGRARICLECCRVRDRRRAKARWQAVLQKRALHG